MLAAAKSLIKPIDVSSSVLPYSTLTASLPYSMILSEFKSIGNMYGHVPNPDALSECPC